MLEDDIINGFKDLLYKEGLKMTAARLAVLENVLSSDLHRECEQIFDDLSRDGISISRATVYRTLDVLVKYDYIRKLDIGDGRIRYEKKIGTDHHDHMICIETGKILEFVDDRIERIQDEIARKKGYKIIKHVHQLFVKPIKK